MLLHTFDIRYGVVAESLHYDATATHVQEYSVFVAIAILRVRNIHTYSNSSSHCVYILQDYSESVPHVVDFRGGMPCTCLLNHFRDSSRMELMVLVT